jgi:hypothetical protein
VIPGRAILVAAAVLATSVAPGVAHAVRASTIVVKAPTVLNMSGSDIYCSLNPQPTGGPTVACFHLPDPSATRRKGYATVASEAFVAVEPPGTTKPNKLLPNPLLASVPRISGGSAHGNRVIALNLRDGALVSGTHMVVTVQTAKGGGNAMGVIYVDGKGNPIPGTYSIGISNHYVTIVKVAAKGAATAVVFRHSVYR